MKSVSRTQRSIYLTSLLASLVLFALAACARKQSETTFPGRIDVSDFDFTEEGVIDLNGPWEFYWERFLYPGDFKAPAVPEPDGYSTGLLPWHKIETTGAKPGACGYATYRLRVLLPEPAPRIGIRISFQNSSYRLFVNGQEAASSGNPATNEAETVPGRVNRIVYFQPRERELELILHVANYYVFRGGLRGNIQLGPAAVLENLRNRGLAMDLIMAGFGLCIWLYHLFLFLQRPQDRSILYFLFLSGSFLPRYFLISERTISLLIGELPFDLEIRMIHSLHVLTPSLLLLFMRSIFPESIPMRTVRLFFLSTFMYFGTWLFSPLVYTKTFIIYSIGASIAVLIPIGSALLGAMKVRARGAFLQSLGILLFVLLLLSAFSRVVLGESSGFLALVAFTTLSFFQALFLSASHTEKMQTNLSMAEQLHESGEALAKQRKELELNLHDALGGSLTDMKIFAERIKKDIPRRSWPDAIDKLDQKISDMIQNFRKQLLFMEDMELASAELFTGLHMALLRRYSDAGRELIFVSSGAGEPGANSSEKNAWFHLLFLAMEICTNDLKYGIGESRWEIVRKGNDLFIHQENRIAGETKGIAGKRVVERTEIMGGVIRSVTKEDRLELTICFSKFFR